MSPAEDDFWLVADRLPGILLLVDLDGRLIKANRQACLALGVQADSVDCSLCEHLPAEDANAFRKFLNRCSGSLQMLPGRVPVRLDNGDVLRLAVNGALVSPGVEARDQKRIVLWSSDTVDESVHRRFVTLNTTIEQLTQEVRARRQAEALMALEKQMLEMLVTGESLETALDLLCDAVRKLMGGGRLMVLLRGEQRFLQCLSGVDLPAEFVHAVSTMEMAALTRLFGCAIEAQQKEEFFRSVIQEDPAWAGLRDAFNQEVLKSCWSMPLREADGRFLGVLALFSDDRQSPSDAQRRILDTLMLITRVTVDRYRTMENLALVYQHEHQERERVEAESRAKDHFLAMLSHELRNPLSAATNAAYALEELASADNQRIELQSIILENTRMLKRILDDLLDLSRLNTGKLSMRMAPLNIATLVNDLIPSFRLTYPQRNLYYTCVQQDLWIEGDHARLQQTIHNLLGNAVKFSSDADETRVTLDADDDVVTLTVCDKGEGIDAALLQDIFKPFFQSASAPGRTDSGLGLGLSLVRQFVEMHGGTITAHSDGRGQGSEFIIRLPRLRSPGAMVPDSTGERADANSTVSKRHILVVEDSEGVRRALCRLLERWGHTVTVAVDGESALRQMLADRPDVALVDIGLPGMSGYELARSIRGDPDLSTIELIALTGFGQEKDRERTAEAGFDKHLVKPVDRGDLLALFGKVNDIKR